MTNAKSYIAARNLRDIFAQLGWAPWDITTVATELPDRVIIAYQSAECSRARSDSIPRPASTRAQSSISKHRKRTCRQREVMVEPYRLTAWLKPRATRPAYLRHELESLLDRKAERPAPPQQGELFPQEALPHAVRESMTPNEL